MLARPHGAGFAIFSGEKLVGMSCYIGVEPERGVLEIGNTFMCRRCAGPGSTARSRT